MNKYQEFFIKNDIKINKTLYDVAEKEILDIINSNKQDKAKLLNEIADVMLKYEIREEVMQLSNTEKERLKLKFNDSLYKLTQKQAEREEKKLNELLEFVAENKYYLNSFNLSLGMAFTLEKITNKKLQEIIMRKIKSKNFSDRIWINKEVIANSLRKEIFDFLNGKNTVNEIRDNINFIETQNAYIVDRLITNETARVLEEINYYWQEEHNIEYVMYSSTLDKHTCDKCYKYDTKVYKTDDKPIDLPQHVKCRCTYISLPSKEYKPKARMDNESKELIDFKDYAEWTKNNNITLKAATLKVE